MSSKSSPLLCFTLLLALSSAIHGFDITKVLSQYPDYGLFNKLLTETKLAEQINSRLTITVLVLSDSALSSVANKPLETKKAILSTHVILDYFDMKKLTAAIGARTQLTTLFQASGLAKDQQGFVSVDLVGEGEIAFASAVPGSPYDTKLVQEVMSQPYNLSIVQVSQPIIAPGIEAAASSSSPSSSSSSKAPAPASASTKAPVPSTSTSGAAAKAPAPSTSGSAKAPAPATKQTAPPPAEEAVAESPVEGEAPAEATTPAEGPAAEEAADEGKETTPPAQSGSSRAQLGLVGAVMGFASLLVAL